MASSDTPQYPQIVHGNDDAANPATAGWYNTHMCINVRDLKASMDFYSKALGMRHLSTIQVTETYSFTFMTHQAGGRSQTGYQTNAEMVREQSHRQGRLGLLYNSHPQAIAALEPKLGVVKNFSHIAIAVPDLQTALEHFKKQGIKIFSGPEDAVQANDPLLSTMGAGFMESGSAEAEGLVGFFSMIKKDLVFLQDPDGNLIEVMAQTAP